MKRQGFTLIELMIVIAILGILAAIAIPSYRDYVIRSKVSELIVAASEAKTAVTEYMVMHSDLPNVGLADGMAANQPFSSITTKYVTSVHAVTDRNATFMIRVDGNAATLGIPDSCLPFVLNLYPIWNDTLSAVDWVCSVPNCPQYAPSSCQDTPPTTML